MNEPLAEAVVGMRRCSTCDELDASTCDRCVNGMLRAWQKRAEHVEAIARKLVTASGTDAYMAAWDELRELVGPWDWEASNGGPA